MLPDDGRFAAVAARLGAGLLSDVRAAYRTYDVTIALPKLRLRSALPLKDTLVGLGMRLACSDADFSGITKADPLQVTDVVHEAVVTLDEKGIEAAAATAVVVGKVSLPGPPVTVTVDRPFLFAVTDVATGVPLFLGRVLAPA